MVAGLSVGIIPVGAKDGVAEGSGAVGETLGAGEGRGLSVGMLPEGNGVGTAEGACEGTSAGAKTTSIIVGASSPNATFKKA